MKRVVKVWGLLGLGVIMSGMACAATQMNFVPANKSMNGATEKVKKVARPAEPAAPKEPSYWDKEAERSGLRGTWNGMGSSLSHIVHMDWIKEQEQKYRERHPKTK